MTKRKAIIKFCVICLITAIGVAAVFVNFRIPFTTTRFVGFAGAIEEKMGIDLKGGILAVFDCEPQNDGDPTPSLDAVKATEARLLNALSNAGLTEATVQRQGNAGNYKIRVEVPGLNETDEIFRAIGDPATLDFRKENSETADKLVEASDIKKVSVYQNPENYDWGVLLTFTSGGGKKFRDMVTTVGQGGSTYIYRNGKLFREVTISDANAGSNNTTVITLGTKSDGSRPGRAEAEDFKLQIESGLFEVKLVIAEQSNIPQTLGSGALTGSIIALVIGIIFIFIFMYLRYGDLGLMSNLALIVYMVLFMGALALVNAVQLTLPGIAGIILSLGMAVDANIIIFECIKDEFKSGKRLAVAVQGGFQKSLWAIFDSNITTIIGAAVLYFLGTGPIKGFAITLVLGVMISMFCSLVITRSFSKLYLCVNPNNAKRLKLESNNPYIGEIQTATAEKPRKRVLNFGESK
ncbi:MAG: SecD/SecF family protein translocase subunit [Christensenellaceae bacterium]|jgi:preprotein translocase subunit SecD|nr:SecD/SecF family protein translocase subunit [Christensenellaceae bacterium]